MPAFNGFVGGSYTGRASNADAERSLNWFPETIQSADGRAKTNRAQLPRPGLKVFSTLPLSGSSGGDGGGGGGGGTFTPLSFVGVDVGSVPTPGYTQTSSTQLVIEGYSNTLFYHFFDRSASPDSYQFAYVSSTPPITVTGRIAAKTGDGGSCAMARTSLVPGAPNVAIGPRTPGLGGFAWVEQYYRDVNGSAGGDAEATGGPDAPPVWVRVSYQTTGTATVFWSLDGAAWTQIGSAVIIVPFAQAAATPIYIGFAVGGYPMIETIDHISVVLA